MSSSGKSKAKALSSFTGLDRATPRAMNRRATRGGYHWSGALLTLVLVLASVLPGCKKSETASSGGGGNSATPAQQPTPPLTDLEQKVQYVRDGQFTHIYVFSRKDGGPFDREDVAYLTANSPVGEKTNMRVKTDDGRRVVVGTNFEYTQENFDALNKRFNIEDFGSGK